jgi:hypothetical protein
MKTEDWRSLLRLVAFTPLAPPQQALRTSGCQNRTFQIPVNSFPMGTSHRPPHEVASIYTAQKCLVKKKSYKKKKVETNKSRWGKIEEETVN